MRSDILILCTGNATRSVLAGAALAERRPDLSVETGGTLAIDGLPISWRTRAAFDDVELAVPPHRSRQATGAMLDAAQLVIGLAPEHIEWVRREHPEAADRAGSLIRLADQLPAGETPLIDRLDTLGLGAAELSPSEEVVDPGGGEVDAFVESARRIVELIDRLAPLL